jgi:hypothetical protein
MVEANNCYKIKRCTEKCLLKILKGLLELLGNAPSVKVFSTTNPGALIEFVIYVLKLKPI